MIGNMTLSSHHFKSGKRYRNDDSSGNENSRIQNSPRYSPISPRYPNSPRYTDLDHFAPPPSTLQYSPSPSSRHSNRFSPAPSGNRRHINHGHGTMRARPTATFDSLPADAIRHIGHIMVTKKTKGALPWERARHDFSLENISALAGISKTTGSLIGQDAIATRTLQELNACKRVLLRIDSDDTLRWIRKGDVVDGFAVRPIIPDDPWGMVPASLPTWTQKLGHSTEHGRDFTIKRLFTVGNTTFKIKGSRKPLLETDLRWNGTARCFEITLSVFSDIKRDPSTGKKVYRPGDIFTITNDKKTWDMIASSRRPELEQGVRVALAKFDTQGLVPKSWPSDRFPYGVKPPRRSVRIAARAT